MSAFDYATAWYEVAAPTYEALPQAIKDVVMLLQTKYSDLHQNRDLSVTPPDDVKAALSSYTAVELMTFARIVNDYGHWRPFGYASSGTTDEKGMQAAEAAKHLRSNGAHWRFENIATQLAHDGRHVGHSEELHQLKIKHERSTDKYMYSEKKAHWLRDCRIAAYYKRPAPTLPPPDITKDDETFEAIQGLWPAGPGTPTRVDRVNQRLKDGIQPVNHGVSPRGPFMITNRHMTGSTGMYLDPNCAPCGRTGNKYSDFTSDRVLVVNFPEDADNEAVKAQLQAIAPTLEAYRIDGFVLTK